MRSITTSALALSLLGLAAAGGGHAAFDDLVKSAGGFLSERGASGAVASSLSDSEIGGGLREALSIGAERAVALLGKNGGFLNDPAVKIPLPGVLGSAAKGLRAAGQGAYVDEFETAVNRAAEQAVPQTLEIVKHTVQDMTLDDVRGILTGGDDAATRFLRERAGGQLQQAILPVVSQATDAAGATSAYKSLRSQADGLLGGLGGGLGALGGLGGLGGKADGGALDLDGYVAEKTLDGLFVKLAAEEKAIRQNPLARSTDLLKTVFGK